MYRIVTNHVNWHREFAVGQGKNRENTRNSKIQFEWVPCIVFFAVKVIKAQIILGIGSVGYHFVPDLQSGSLIQGCTVMSGKGTLHVYSIGKVD